MKILSDIKIIDCPNCYGTGRVEKNNICGACRGAGSFESVLEIVKKNIKKFFIEVLRENSIRKLTEQEIYALVCLFPLRLKITLSQLVDVLETYKGKYFYEI